MGVGRPRNTPENFWLKVDVRGDSECWPWKRALRNGYGNHCVNRRTMYAHRYAYELCRGPVPGGMHVMHLCNNKLCCNPAHMKAGTPQENTRAAYQDGLARAGERHPMAKFSREVIEAIRRDPRPQLELERIYGVSQQHISRIKSGHSRQHEEANAN